MLFLELGNSTIKLARAIDNDTFLLERFASSDGVLKRLTEIDDEIICAPVGEKFRSVATRLERRSNVRTITRELLLPHVAGTYDTPDTLGIDRVLNVLGMSADGVVVSCGTAITVDARIDGRARWGAIMPGFATAAAGLHARVPSLPLIDIEREPSLPARSSTESVVNGIVLGTARAAFGLADELRRAIAPSEVLDVTITGGDAQILERLWPADGRDPIVDEMLIFAGMAAVMRSAPTSH